MRNFKTVKLNCESSKDIHTEIYFEIASARAEKCEVIRLEYDLSSEKNEALIISTLKKMKANSAIQFFATNSNFKQSNTEAVFLINKYPEIFNEEFNENSHYLYVKI